MNSWRWEQTEDKSKIVFRRNMILTYFQFNFRSTNENFTGIIILAISIIGKSQKEYKCSSWLKIDLFVSVNGHSIFNILFYLLDWTNIFADFSLKNFLESQGGKLVEFLPTTVSSLLLKTLGIDKFLLSTPCLKSSASSIQVQVNFSSSGMFIYVFGVLLPTISRYSSNYATW